jgi:hypothetical protein
VINGFLKDKTFTYLSEKDIEEAFARKVDKPVIMTQAYGISIRNA